MNNQPENPSESFPQTRTGKLTRRRRILLWGLGITVFLLLSIIVSQQLWLWKFVPPDTASDTLLLYALSTLNFVAFVVFSFIFVRNLLKLRRERRELQLGSKIKTRLLVYFIAISFLPIIAMAAFSYLFLNRSLEKWFARLPARVVNEAQEMQREALDAQTRNLRETASLLAVVLRPQSDSEKQQTLDRIVANAQLSAVEVIDSNGRVVSQSKAQLSAVESKELESLLERARALKGLDESLADGKDLDAVVVPLNETEAPGQQLIVVSLRRATSDLSDTLTGSQGEYRHLVERQSRVRSLGLSTLGLMTLILLFVSSWVAIHLARGIATPIKALAEASKEIARGNLSHRVTTIAEDELALLAHSFNQMTAQLEDNRSRIEAGSAALREKNLTLEERRDYIETILQSLSTGVVSLDEDDCVTTINAAASRILRLGSVPANERKLENLMGTEAWSVIDRILRRARRTGQATEQAQLAGADEDAESTPLPVALTATALRASAAQKRGVVLVLEDLSELLAAQRVAAWSEVARRMAHEIKNPLTPIQLSAERIAKSYRRAKTNADQNGDGQNGLNGEAGEVGQVGAVIEECTETIGREVAGLKAMVDEFSRFARLPLARLEVADLNEVVRHAVGLYDDRLGDVNMETNLDANLPTAMLDTEQLRRVFVNLIDNASNALAGLDGERLINISTSYDSSRSLLIAEVSDTGHGIRPADFKRLFQPYFSTRGSGTGLGLAIVQRIVLEHGGRIRAGVNYPRGARFVIELPAGTDGRPTTGDR